MGLRFRSETSRRIYAYMLRAGKPVRLSDIRRDLNLGSSALVKHHIDNLIAEGLVERVDEGLYVAKPPKGYVKLLKFAVPGKVLLGSMLVASVPVEASLYSLNTTALFLYSMIISIVSGVAMFYEGYKSYEELTRIDNPGERRTEEEEG
ncbi:MAG: hypothetical protein ACP5HQ_02355 [Thermoprotei archaeon]